MTFEAMEPLGARLPWPVYPDTELRHLPNTPLRANHQKAWVAVSAVVNKKATGVAAPKPSPTNTTAAFGNKAPQRGLSSDAITCFTSWFSPVEEATMDGPQVTHCEREYAKRLTEVVVGGQKSGRYLLLVVVAMLLLGKICDDRCFCKGPLAGNLCHEARRPLSRKLNVRVACTIY